MAGASETLDLSQFAAWAERTARNLQADATPAIKQCLVLVSAETKRNFAEGHGPDGEAWAPLKNPRNRARDRRARGGGGQKPLRDTGILMGSVTAAGPGHIEQVGPDGFTYGTNLDYAAVHQYGAAIHKSARTRQKPWVFPGPDGPIFTRRIKAHVINIPARPFLGWNDDMVEGCANIFGEWVEKQLGS